MWLEFLWRQKFELRIRVYIRWKSNVTSNFHPYVLAAALRAGMSIITELSNCHKYVSLLLSKQWSWEYPAWPSSLKEIWRQLNTFTEHTCPHPSPSSYYLSTWMIRNGTWNIKIPKNVFIECIFLWKFFINIH